MNHLGHLKFIGGGELKNMRPELLATDPLVGELLESRFWYNTAEKALKYFDGVQVWPIAKGGDLDNYLKRDGSMPMTGELTLSSADQSAAANDVAISKGHLDTELAKKEEVLTGAATTIAHADLALNKAVVSDASGKVVVAAASSAEVDYLVGVTSGIQAQLDGKEATLGYTPLDVAGSQGGMQVDLAMNNNTVIGLKAAVDPTSPMRKAEFDASMAGLNWQQDVNAHQDDATLDPGAAPTKGDRYIINDAAALHANFGTIDKNYAGEATVLGNGDIVEFDGTEFVISFDVSADPLAEGALAWCNAESQYHRYVAGAWTTFYGLESAVGGAGLVKDGNTFNVNFGAGIQETPLDEVGIHYATDGGVWTQIAGVESSDAASTLAIKLDAATLALSANGLAVNAGGITEVEVNASTLSNGLTGGDGVKVSVVADTGIIVGASGVSLDQSVTDALYINVDGDTMTGELSGIDGTTAGGFLTKQTIEAADQVLADAIAALGTKVSAGHVVYDGTATASALHTVIHNIGNKYPTPTIVDELDNVILPDEITFVDANTLTVSFTAPAKCRVIVTGAKA